MVSDSVPTPRPTFHFAASGEQRDWSPVTAHFEILGCGENAVLLQVDEHGMPYTPEPLMINGKPVEITCENTSLRIYKEPPDGV